MGTEERRSGAVSDDLMDATRYTASISDTMKQSSGVVIDEFMAVNNTSGVIKIARMAQTVNTRICQFTNLFTNMPVMPWPILPQRKYADMNADILKDRMRKNQALGEAMYAVKWYGLKHYLTLDQRQKQRLRVRLERDRKAQRLMDEYRVILFTIHLENKNEQASS